MTFLSANMERIPASQTMAVTDLARELVAAGKDVIGMSTGEPDFETVRSAAQAGVEAINTGDTRYTAGDGSIALKEAIRQKFKRDNGLDYDVTQISVSNGGKQVIYNAMLATLDPGDEVIIPVPYWVSYPVIVSMCGGTPVYVACDAGCDFMLDSADIEAAITPRTKWLFLNFPNNPSGGIMSRASLLSLADVLRRHPHVHIMTDDIYEFLQFSSSPFVTLAQVAPDLQDRTLTVNGMSKGYAMTGWRIGFAAGRPDLIKAMARIQSQVTASPCSISQAAATNALLAPPAHVPEWNRIYIERRDIVVSALSALDGIQIRMPEGAFYAFPEVTGLYGGRMEDGAVIENASDVATYWLKSAGVAVVPGDAFGQPGHVRISYSISTGDVKRAMSRITRAHHLIKHLRDGNA